MDDVAEAPLPVGAPQAQGVAPTQAGDRTPLYSVVIPHYPQPDLLERCLESLMAQENAPPFEVIVVDNASKEMPTAVCARFPQVHLLLETIKGPGPARNMGAREARSPVIVFLDSDSVADPDWLAVVHRTVTARPDCGIFCGDVRILPIDQKAMNAVECYEELFAYRCELIIKKFKFAPTERGVAVYSAHRDTHFRFLKDVAIGDEIDVTRHDGKTFRYRADGSSIVRFDQSGIDPFTTGHELVLTTCWPFDAITHGPLRYALHATMIAPPTPAAPSSPL